MRDAGETSRLQEQRLDVYASRGHYLDHLAPIWRALPPERRGRFIIDHAIAGEARRRGLDCEPGTPGLGPPILVAGMVDAVKGRPVALLEHGAGQTYGNRHRSYAGGVARDHVSLFLCPGPAVARANRDAYPAAAVAEVGCPKLEALAVDERGLGCNCAGPAGFYEPGWTCAGPFEVAETCDYHGNIAEDRPLTFAVSFHWDAGHVSPEARSAWDHYRTGLEALADAFPGRLIGHAHPRQLVHVAPVYRRAGIELVRDFADVVARADVYACDNSSTMFEWAALGRPVIVMNAPWYRRDVEHGLRFWSCADVGPNVEDLEGLVATMRSLETSAELWPRERARQIVDEVYGPGAPYRGPGDAVEALVAWLDSGPPAVPVRRKGRG